MGNFLRLFWDFFIDNHIYYTGKLIQTHPICGKRMNYDRGDYEGIMRSSMWGMDDSGLKRMVSENLTLLDGIGGERDV